MTTSIHDTDQTRLQRHLRELGDRIEITDLISRLGRWLDERIGEPRSIFAEDVRADTPGGQVRGIDLATAQATRNHTPDRRFQHLLTNVLVELDGDHATVSTNMLLSVAPNAAPGGPTAGVGAPGVTFQLGGRYRFEATRTPEGWRLSAVSLRPVWSSGSLDGATPHPAAVS
jgi:SnoaL-like domain